MVKKTESDKVLKEKTFKIISNLKCNGHERGLASMVYKIFGEKSKSSGIKSMSNQQMNLQMNFLSQLLENSKDTKSILLLKTVFGSWSCWYAINKQIQ